MSIATSTRARQHAIAVETQEEPTWGLPPYLEIGPVPDVDALITEDDTPVDNIFSAKQQRLLVESLYTSWAGPGPGRSFLADANVGLFYTPRQPPLVPDAFVSLDVQVAEKWWEKRNRSYFFWEFGKPPEIVVEVVSNAEGREDTDKIVQYAGMGILYYVIFDPLQQLSSTPRRIYRLTEQGYRRTEEGWFAPVGLGVRLWSGEYEGLTMEWLRWYGLDGELILTGAEHSARERQRAEQERQRAERLAAQLRALGVEPEA